MTAKSSVKTLARKIQRVNGWPYQKALNYVHGMTAQEQFELRTQLKDEEKKPDPDVEG